MNTLRGQSTEFCDMRAGGTYRNQFTLRADLFRVVLRKDKSQFFRLQAS